MDRRQQQLLWIASESYLEVQKLGLKPNSFLGCCQNEDGKTIDGYYIDPSDVTTVCDILSEVGIYWEITPMERISG